LGRAGETLWGIAFQTQKNRLSGRFSWSLRWLGALTLCGSTVASSNSIENLIPRCNYASLSWLALYERREAPHLSVVVLISGVGRSSALDNPH